MGGGASSTTASGIGPNQPPLTDADQSDPRLGPPGDERRCLRKSRASRPRGDRRGEENQRRGVRWQPIKMEQETVEGGGVVTCATNLSEAL